MRFGVFTIEKKQSVPLSIRIINPMLFVVLGFLFSAIFIAAAGFEPLRVFSKMISYSFFNLRGITSSLNAAMPLMFCGLSVAVAFKMNLNNIGAEGQFAAGAIAGAGVALYGPSLPFPVSAIVMVLFCMAGGAIWAAIAALLKAFWNINETIVTLMLNYIALLLLNYLCHGPWMAQKQTTAMSETIPDAFHIPMIAGASSGVLIAIVCAVILTWFYRYTTGGYQMEVMKYSPRSAEYAGISVRKYIVIVFVMSGVLAGLAGYTQVSGILHRVQSELPGGAGYTGIVIAYLSRFHPMAVILVAFLLGGLANSCAVVQIMGVPSQIATMMQGTIMIFVIIGEFFSHYQVKLDQMKERGDAK